MISTQTLHLPSDYEEYIDSIRWDELSDAYGNSGEVYRVSPQDKYGTASLPTLLKQLCSDDKDLQQDAVNDGIWSRAYHQGTLYPASPFAAKALLILLRSRTVAQADYGHGPIYRDIFRFLDWCVLRFGHKQTEQPFVYLVSAVRENIETVRLYAADPNPDVRSAVSKLIEATKIHHIL